MGARASFQSGQGLVEYLLIMVIVAVLMIVVLTTMGGQIRSMFVNVIRAFS